MPDAAPSRRRAWVAAAVGAGVLAVLVGIGLAWPTGTWHRSGPPLTVAAWVPYWQTAEAYASFDAHAPLFGDVSIVAYSVQGAGLVVPFDRLPSDAVPRFRARTAQAGTKLLMSVSDAMPAGGMAAVLADPTTRRLHITTLLAVVAATGSDGLDLDYEQFAFADHRGSWTATRPAWVMFVTELAAALHATGKQITVTVPPVYDAGTTSNSGYWVYDIAAIGQEVDRIRVMAYDYSVAEPGPIAPIDWVTGVVRATTDLVPATKIDLGVPVYGYDWPTSVTGTCPTDQIPKRRSLSIRSVNALLAERELTPVWDDATAELRFDYGETLSGADAAGAATTCTVARTVHYLDATSVQRRAWVAYRHDLHGVALWSLGNEDEATWTGLRAARDGVDVPHP
jgi:spore germination protein YaaH